MLINLYFVEEWKRISLVVVYVAYILVLCFVNTQAVKKEDKNGKKKSYMMKVLTRLS